MAHISNYIAAIDLGTSRATLAVGAPADDGRLSVVGLLSRPLPAGVSRGDVANRQQVSEVVRTLLSEAEQTLGIRISDLYTSISGRHIRSATHQQHIPVGEYTDGEIRSQDVDVLLTAMAAVQPEEGFRILERIPQHYTIDGRDITRDPAGRFGSKLEATFNYILGSYALTDRLEKTLLSLGVRVRRTYAGGVASSVAVTLPEERETGVVVIDLGAGTTDLCVWHEGVVKFVRSIPLGGGDVNRDIHQQGILEKHVEDLKLKFGRAMASQVKADKLIAITGRSPRDKQEISQRNLGVIIEQRLREIAEFVTKEIGDSGIDPGTLRAGVILTGGGSQLAGVDALFRDALGVEARTVRPDLHLAPDCVELAGNPCNSTIIGVLLRALEEPAFTSSPPIPAAGRANHTSGRTDYKDFRSDDGDDPEKNNKKPKRPGRLKSWFEGFLSDTLDGDEDL